MSGKNFVYRFNLDGNTGITYYRIYLKASVGTPKSKLLIALIVSKPCFKLLYYKVLKGVSVFSSATDKIIAMKQMIDNSHVKVVEARSLNQSALHHFGECR